MIKAMMYFLYFFQIKNTKVFNGFTNQLKDVLGRFGLSRGSGSLRAFPTGLFSASSAVTRWNSASTLPIRRKVFPLLSTNCRSSGFIWLRLLDFFFFFFLFFFSCSASLSSLSMSSWLFSLMSGHQPFILLLRKMEKRGPALSLAILMLHCSHDFAARTISLRRNSMDPKKSLEPIRS